VCTNRAYAYCRVIAGRATTGCLPRTSQRDRPTENSIVERLHGTFQRIGFIDSNSVELVPGHGLIPLAQARSEVSEFLYRSMRLGRPATLQRMIRDDDDDFTDISTVHFVFRVYGLMVRRTLHVSRLAKWFGHHAAVEKIQQLRVRRLMQS
jgi:hypothetical protein